MLFVETKKAVRIPVLGEWSQKCVEAEKMSLNLSKEGCSLVIQYFDGSITSFYGMTYSVTTGNGKDSIRFYGMTAPEFGGRQEFYCEVKNDQLTLTDKNDENFEMVFSRVWK